MRAFRGRRAFRDAGDPDVILRIDEDSADLTENPLIGQCFRPRRIDLEFRTSAVIAGRTNAAKMRPMSATVRMSLTISVPPSAFAAVRLRRDRPKELERPEIDVTSGRDYT